MARCPNCDNGISWAVSTCPRCNVDFGRDSAWWPVAESPEEQALLEKSGKFRTVSPPKIPSSSFFGALNVAVAVGFLALYGLEFLSLILPVYRLLMGLIADPQALAYVSILERRQLALAVGHVVPSMIAYFALRRMPVSGLQIFGLLVCNALLITCSAVGYSILDKDLSLAGSFIKLALAAVALPTLGVAFAILLIAFPKWMALPRSERQREPPARWIEAIQAVIVLILGLLPVTYFVFRLNVGEDSPGVMLAESRARLATLCKDVLEKRYVVPASINGVYLERKWVGSGDFSYSFIRSSTGPAFIEVPNERRSAKQRYVRTYHGGTRSEVVDGLLAEYGVFFPDTLNERDKKIGVAAIIILVKDLRTDSVVGELRYYGNNKTNDLCVPRPAKSAEGRGISQAYFIYWALGLAK